MAKISTYPLDSTPNLGDKLIGTDVNDSNATKNLTIGQILSVPGSSAYVPYTGATANVDLGLFGITAAYVNPGGQDYELLRGDGSFTGSALRYYSTSPVGGEMVSMDSVLYADVTSQDDLTSLIIGKGAGIGITGTTNIGVGAGFNNTGAENTFIGTDAGKMDTTAAGCDYNTAIGYGALGNPNLDYLEKNTFVGYLAGRDVTTDHNTGVGSEVMSIGTGNENSALGFRAMYQQSGNANSALGWDALSESNGDRVCAIGFQSGKNNTGNDNVFIGDNSGSSNIGNNVLAIGKLSAESNNSNNVIAIGNSAAKTNTASEIVAIGGSALDQNSKQGSIGIGLNAGVSNSGDELIAIGREAAITNSGANVIAIGPESASGNIGTGVIAMGFGTGTGNTFNNVVLLGDSVTASANNQMVVLANTSVNIKAATDFNNVTADRVVNFPDADGTMVLSVNGTAPNAAGDVTLSVGAPYLVWSARVQYSGGNLTVMQQLENTTGATIAFASAFGGVTATASSPIFTSANVAFVMPSSYTGSASLYTVLGFFSSTTVMNIFSYDSSNTLATENNKPFLLEIRIYP